MNITKAEYSIDPTTNEPSCIKATIDGVEMSVPLAPANRHYQAIKNWEAEGNTITTPTPDVDAAWTKLRAERDAKLAASDWIVVKSYEAGEPVPQFWVDYRQALRDLPANTVDPFNPVWPQEPA